MYQLLKLVGVNHIEKLFLATQVCGPVRNFRYEMVYMPMRMRYRKYKEMTRR